ncbi:hypothetical protein BDV93DRAFT_605897 [Ceratobasidium sp. AG-I]|nr:hypothetical protein BDV93DRAFT_605897 [Ceratobasidium sp. AG-I]
MVYNTILLIHMLLTCFPVIGKEELDTVQLILEHILTFNTQIGRVVLTRDNYEHAQELLPQLLILAARHGLIYPFEHKPSFMNMFIILQTIVKPIMANLTPLDLLEVGATKADIHQLSKLSLERLQADVDAWVCEHAELALLKPLSTPALRPLEDRPHNLTARNHGDVWWHAVPTTKPRPRPLEAGLPKLTEANLEKLQAELKQLNAKKVLRVYASPTAVPHPDAPGQCQHKNAARDITMRDPIPRLQFLAVGYQSSFCSESCECIHPWISSRASKSSRGDFSSGHTSLGPSTPRDSRSRCGGVLLGMASPSIARSDASSEDFQARPEQLVHKAKEVTTQRKFVRKLRAALSAIRFGYN